MEANAHSRGENDSVLYIMMLVFYKDVNSDVVLSGLCIFMTSSQAVTCVQ